MCGMLFFMKKILLLLTVFLLLPGCSDDGNGSPDVVNGEPDANGGDDAWDASSDDDYDDDYDDAGTGGDDAGVGGDDASAGDDGPVIPPDPTPFTLTVSGATDASIVFDQSTCEIYPRPSWINFRHFWRGTGHNAVLIAEVLGVYSGPGTYDQSMGMVRAKLQSEAGSPYNFFFQTDAAQGDTLTLVVENADIRHGVWGEFTFSSMHDASGGSITIAPQPVPLWCPDLTD
jgi:hypothetical protein